MIALWEILTSLLHVVVWDMPAIYISRFHMTVTYNKYIYRDIAQYYYIASEQARYQIRWPRENQKRKIRFKVKEGI